MIPTIIDYNELANNRNFKRDKLKKENPAGLKIVNNLPEGTEEDKKLINRSIYTKYTSEPLSNLPQCECGAKIGEFNLGVKCQECGTVVKSQIDQELHSLVWIQAPQGVEDLMNPTVWTMLNKRFSKSGFEIIRWLCDSSYSPTSKPPPILDSVKALGIPRGYNNFVRNFDAIMDQMFSLKGFGVRPGDYDPLKELIRLYRHCVFSKYLPVPNKILMVIEETNLGAYVDPNIVGAIDAIRTMVGIDSEDANFSIPQKERRTVKTLALFSEYNENNSKDYFASKQGVFRRHVFGWRSHFSYRAVISSITDTYRHDEIHIPWGVGIEAYSLHLSNKLFFRGYNPNQIKAFLYKHAQKYHPLLDELFQELFAETPDGYGDPTIMGRNPSLERGSTQLVYATKVKTNVNDPTVSISILCVKALNADFDGDAMNFTLAIDRTVADPLYNLAPHKSTFDLDKPREVSGNIAIPKPVIATFANWLHSSYVEPEDPEKTARMQALFM